MLTALDHSRYAFFRNRAARLVPNTPCSSAASLNFWRWWQNAFAPNAKRLHAAMPRHAMVTPYRNQDWRKSIAKRQPVRAAWHTSRGQRLRGCAGVFLAHGTLVS